MTKESIAGEHYQTQDRIKKLKHLREISLTPKILKILKAFLLNFIKAVVYTLCEDNLVPWLRYSFSDISLSVCLFMCAYMMLVALSMCLRVGVGIV